MTKVELVAQLRDARDNAVDPGYYEAMATAVNWAMEMPAQQGPSPLEIALRLIESGKCPAIPTQARAAAFALIDAVRAEEARRAGK